MHSYKESRAFQSVLKDIRPRIFPFYAPVLPPSFLYCLQQFNFRNSVPINAKAIAQRKAEDGGFERGDEEHILSKSKDLSFDVLRRIATAYNTNAI